MIRNDYILDMIEDFGELLRKSRRLIGYSEEMSTVNHDDSLGEAGLLGIMLKRKIGQGHINEAENMLFDALEQTPTPELLYVAMDFYKELCMLPEHQLASCNFSRQEIEEGIQAVKAFYQKNGLSTQID